LPIFEKLYVYEGEVTEVIFKSPFGAITTASADNPAGQQSLAEAICPHCKFVRARSDTRCTG
jgi:hypothetical protein